MVAAIDIISVFSFSFDLESQIQELLDVKLDSVEKNDLVDEIIDEIRSIEESIATEQNSPNNALIKADVLEWESGGKRSLGLKTSRIDLLLKLNNLLGLQEAGLMPPNLRSILEDRSADFLKIGWIV
jgi:hypothetical protein